MNRLMTDEETTYHTHGANMNHLDLGPEDDRTMSRVFNLPDITLLIFEECGMWDLLCLQMAHPLFKHYITTAPTLRRRVSW